MKGVSNLLGRRACRAALDPRMLGLPQPEYTIYCESVLLLVYSLYQKSQERTLQQLQACRLTLEAGELRAPAEYRLAFRGLGLAIGLAAVQQLWQTSAQSGAAARPTVRAQLEALMRYAPLGEEIESFWRDPAHQRASTWSEHRDINEVMLATRLAPDAMDFSSLHRPINRVSAKGGYDTRTRYPLVASKDLLFG